MLFMRVRDYGVFLQGAQISEASGYEVTEFLCKEYLKTSRFGVTEFTCKAQKLRHIVTEIFVECVS